MDSKTIAENDPCREMRSDNLQRSSQNILEATSSYYNQTERRWYYGTLSLEENAIEFQENVPKKGSIDACHIRLPLNDISAIQRKNSSFIFGSVVITSGSSAHWFSSFPNRDSVFNILNLFWHYRIYSGTAAQCTRSSSSAEGSTKLGRELLRLVHESEKTLTVAAENLEHQGEQLDHASDVMEDIDSDLSVAEWLIGLISPWKYTSRDQKSVSHDGREEFEFVSRRSDQFCVVYCLHTDNDLPTWLIGMLEASNYGLKLFDTKMQVIANFTKHSVKVIQIISSWEMKIVSEQENQSSVSYGIKCPSLSDLRIVLNVLYGDKIVFLNTIPWKIRSEDQATSSTVTWSPPKTAKQNSAETQKAALTDNEIDELNATIAQLKSLAVVVGLEQSSQMEKIESLIQSVSKTDIRIQDDIKKIKKLS